MAIPITDEHGAFVRTGTDLLREAVRVAAAPDLARIVERFTRLVLDACDAFRASVFLLDEGSGALVLWGAASHDPRSEMWELGLELGPISLDEVPLRRELFELGDSVAIPDARASELVPDAWCEAFDLGALVVAPLVAAGEPLGLLVADWPERREIDEGPLALIGAIAGSLALAVHGAALSAREAERSEALQALLVATTVLSSNERLEELAGRLTEPLARALGATGISICALDERARYRTLAAWQPVVPEVGRLRDLGGDLATELARLWVTDPSPLLLPARVGDDARPRTGPRLVLPLTGADRAPLGFVIASLHEREPAARALELASAMAAHLAAVLERARLREKLAFEYERLRGLCALWGFGGEALEAFASAVEDAIGPALGFHIVHVSVADEELRALALFAPPDDVDRTLLHRWGRKGRRGVERLLAFHSNELAAPVVVHGDLVGVVRARAASDRLSDRECHTLGALASAIGKAVEQEVERRAAAARDLELTLADERERIAARLHDTVGRLLYTLNLRAGLLRLAVDESELAGEAREIEGLARSGLTALRRAVTTMASLRGDELEIVNALERAADEYRQTHLADVTLDIDAAAISISPRAQQALIRAADEALSNVERHAEARHVAVSLDVHDTEAVLRVRDDGLGLARSRAPRGTGVGLDLVRSALEPLGGTAELYDGDPGAEMVVRVPLGPAPVALAP